MLGLKTPDLTPAQMIAVLGWAAAQAVAFGWLSQPASQFLLSVTSTVLAAAWKIADALIRRGRAQAAAAAAAAEATTSAAAAAGGP